MNLYHDLYIFLDAFEWLLLGALFSLLLNGSLLVWNVRQHRVLRELRKTIEIQREALKKRESVIDQLDNEIIELRPKRDERGRFAR